MKKHITRGLKAIAIVMVFSASIHMTILFIRSIRENNWQLMNYYNILDLEVIFPSLQGIFSNHILSISTIAILLLIAYHYSKDR